MLATEKALQCYNYTEQNLSSKKWVGQSGELVNSERRNDNEIETVVSCYAPNNRMLIIYEIKLLDCKNETERNESVMK